MDIGDIASALLSNRRRYVAASLLVNTSFADLVAIDREVAWSAMAPAVVTDKTMLRIPRWRPETLSQRGYLNAILRQKGGDYVTVSWASRNLPLADDKVTQLIDAIADPGHTLPEVSPFGSLPRDQLLTGITCMTDTVQQTADDHRWALEGDSGYATQACRALWALMSFYH